MLLTMLTTTPIEDAVQESTSHGFDVNALLGIVLIIAVILIVVGIVKKALSLCIVAIVLAALLGITTPESITTIKDKIVSVFDGAIDTMKQEDYSDLIGDDIFDNLGQKLDDIGKDTESENEDNHDK